MKLDTVPPADFFKLLYSNEEFCTSLGKVVLAAQGLETLLRRHMRARNSKNVRSNATLGALVRQMKDSHLLTRNGQMHFDDLVIKRNYLAHSVYDLFHFEVAETILSRSDLVNEDVELFCERAQALADDFNFFQELVLLADPMQPKLL